MPERVLFPDTANRLVAGLLHLSHLTRDAPLETAAQRAERESCTAAAKETLDALSKQSVRNYILSTPGKAFMTCGDPVCSAGRYAGSTSSSSKDTKKSGAHVTEHWGKRQPRSQIQKTRAGLWNLLGRCCWPMTEEDQTSTPDGDSARAAIASEAVRLVARAILLQANAETNHSLRYSTQDTSFILPERIAATRWSAALTDIVEARRMAPPFDVTMDRTGVTALTAPGQVPRLEWKQRSDCPWS